MKKLHSIYIFCCILLSIFASSCENAAIDTASSTSSDVGLAGSLARFAIVGNYLYAVDNNSLLQYDITNQPTINYVREIPVTTGVETIFPRGEYLFLGTQTGMYIYKSEADGDLNYVSRYEHIIACDPVVADDDHAYVTLRSGDFGCSWTAVNELQVIDIQDLINPTKIAQFEMDFPKGLGLKENTLFLCDQDRLKVFDVQNPTDIQSIATFDELQPNDVILLDDIALVISPTALHQFNFSDLNNIYKLSEMQY